MRCNFSLADARRHPIVEGRRVLVNPAVNGAVINEMV
jgi:hypothetical protein